MRTVVSRRALAFCDKTAPKNGILVFRRLTNCDGRRVVDNVLRNGPVTDGRLRSVRSSGPCGTARALILSWIGYCAVRVSTGVIEDTGGVMETFLHPHAERFASPV